MANTIRLRRSAVASAVPTTTQLELGEVAINTFDGKLFIKKNDGTESIVEIGAGGSGGSGGTSITTEIVSATSVSAQKDYRYILTNNSQTTVTLPSSPTQGDTVYIIVCNNLATNIVARNGKNIMSVAEDLTLNVDDISVGLVFANTSLGWRVI